MGQVTAAPEGLLAAGTNAVPHLLKWIRYEPSLLRKKLENGIRAVVPARLLHIPTQDSREFLAIGTVAAFQLLGTNAAAAMPELQRLAQDASAPQTACRAVYGLSCLGTNGLRALLAIIQTPYCPHRSYAIRALHNVPPGDLEACAAQVAEHLIRCLDEPPTNLVPMNAAITLSNLRLAPDISVLALQSKLSTTPDPVMRVWCIRALGEFGTQAVHALPLIQSALTNSDYRVRVAAKETISRIESGGAPAVPAK